MKGALSIRIVRLTVCVHEGTLCVRSALGAQVRISRVLMYGIKVKLENPHK